MTVTQQEKNLVPDGATYIGHNREIAAQLQQENPDWVIIYGSYSHEFVAFPMYPDAPAHSYLAATDPGKLIIRMRDAQERYERFR